MIERRASPRVVIGWRTPFIDAIYDQACASRDDNGIFRLGVRSSWQPIERAARYREKYRGSAEFREQAKRRLYAWRAAQRAGSGVSPG